MSRSEAEEQVSKMSGVPVGDTAEHDRLGRFTTGNNAYRARRQRIEARAAELAQEYDATGAAARMLLKVAATHLDTAERAGSNSLRSRSTRLALKVLATLQRKETPLSPLEEYLEAKVVK